MCEISAVAGDGVAEVLRALASVIDEARAAEADEAETDVSGEVVQ